MKHKFHKFMPLLTLNLSCENVKYPARKHFEKTNIVRDTPLGAGFVDIFIGQIHSESDDQIQ